jgi:hypothetical protein
VSKGDTITKLETLLARIRTRAAEPRRPAVARAAVAAVAKPEPEPLPVRDELIATSARPSVDDEVTLAQPTRPPPSDDLESDAVEAVDVDVQDALTGETVIGVPAEEPPIPEAFESRERLVAAEPVAELATAEAAMAAPAPVEEPPQEVVAVAEAPSELLAAEEDVEDAPLSSRRPVAPQPEERLAEMAFGAEEPRPPRHTPPPESGRLPAAPVVEFDGDVTGVHETPAVPHRAEPEPEPEPELPRRAAELVPETTTPELPSGEVVADVVGMAQAFAPSTFVALLDASLAL